jgi:hypothetical protein
MCFKRIRNFLFSSEVKQRDGMFVEVPCYYLSNFGPDAIRENGNAPIIGTDRIQLRFCTFANAPTKDIRCKFTIHGKNARQFIDSLRTRYPHMQYRLERNEEKPALEAMYDPQFKFMSIREFRLSSSFIFPLYNKNRDPMWIARQKIAKIPFAKIKLVMDIHRVSSHYGFFSFITNWLERGKVNRIMSKCVQKAKAPMPDEEAEIAEEKISRADALYTVRMYAMIFAKSRGEAIMASEELKKSFASFTASRRQFITGKRLMFPIFRMGRMRYGMLTPLRRREIKRKAMVLSATELVPFTEMPTQPNDYDLQDYNMEK